MVDPDSVWYAETCVFCWQNPLYAKGGKIHSTNGCPLLMTFNKVRKSANLMPITSSQDGWVATQVKAAIKPETVVKEVDSWKKEVRGELSAHTKRLDALEKKTGLKHKVEDTGQSEGPVKKRRGRKARKGNAQTGGGNAPANATGSGQNSHQLPQVAVRQRRRHGQGAIVWWMTVTSWRPLFT